MSVLEPSLLLPRFCWRCGTQHCATQDPLVTCAMCHARLYDASYDPLIELARQVSVIRISEPSFPSVFPRMPNKRLPKRLRRNLGRMIRQGLLPKSKAYM